MFPSAPGVAPLRFSQTKKKPGISRKSLAHILIAAAFFTGLVSVFTSTGYLVQFKHWAIVFPWQFPIWAISPFVLTGVFLFLAVVIYPSSFWSLLVVTAVPTAGMFVLRFPIFDEWLAGWIAFGGLVAVIIGSVPLKKRLTHPVWTMAFLLLALHLTLLSIAGIIVYHNPKAARFVLLNVVLLTTSGLISFFEFPRPSARKTTSLVASSGAFFCLLYLFHGWVFASHVKTGILEGIGFATSGYQTAPFLVVVPAALILIAREKKWARLGGIVLLGLCLLVSALADSRGGMLAILVPVVLVLLAFGIKRMMKILLWGTIFSIIGGSIAYHNPRWFLDAVDSASNAFKIDRGSHTYKYFGRTVKTARGDGGRLLYLKSGMRFLWRELPFPALTGAGVYGYFPAAGRTFKEIAAETGIDATGVNSGATLGNRSPAEPPRPPAAGAIMVETGWVGIGLLAFCALMSISVALLRTGRGNRIRMITGSNLMVAGTVVTLMGFTYFSELQDMVLAFLLIMPGGLAHAWATDPTAQAPETPPIC